MDEFKNLKSYITKYQLGSTLDNVSFKCLTSLKIGGTCKLMYIPDDIESLDLVIKYMIVLKIPYFIIGSGTNLLVNDREFDIVVVSLKNIKRHYILKEDKDNIYIYVESGAKAPIVSTYIARKGIGGAEFLSGIPGSMGGLIYMNAGAYKKSIEDIIDTVTYIDDKGDIQTISNQHNNLHFSYRHSIFQDYNYVILSCSIKLPKTKYAEDPQIKIKRFLDIKKESQPLDTYNAGSTFKNNDSPAWMIIDQLGYRGYRINDAMVSTKHANFLINNGNATFLDMMMLIEMIKYDAKTKLNIEMKCEWEIIE